MSLETVNKITCDCCGKAIEVPDVTPFLLYMYVLFGWTLFDRRWYCKDCRPEQIKVDFERHPHYCDYHDQWDNLPEDKRKSHSFEDEPYDRYADLLQYNLCRMCEYSNLGAEDDGSTWLMCCVEDPKDSWGHNLYSGHFYGAAIGGRICPYFRYGNWKGRDPIEDKKNGTFHVPYNECYDGD